MRTQLEESAVAALRDGLRGDVVVPGDSDYDAARVVWNGMIDRFPAIVARCAGTADVIAAVRFARDQDLVVAVRGGGHSVGGFSTCDGGIVIDLSGMRGVRVDPERRVARVNGGAHLGELDREAQAFGLACPVGVVGHTGVAGLTLGGGMGRLQRKLGFTIDNLLSVELVTADGRLIRASEEEKADLFWGIRGAGANFGVVTSFEFRLHPIGPLVTHGWVAYPADRAHESVARFAEFAATAPHEFMPSINFGAVSPEDPWPSLVGQTVVRLGGTHCGPVEDAERDLRSLRAGGALADTFEPKPYLSLQVSGDEAMAWGKRFYMRGGFADAITDEVVDACLEHVADAPGDCEISLWGQGGAISRIPDDAMAFTGRDAAFWIGAETFWEDPARDDEFVSWGRTAWDALKPFTAAGHYVNDMVETGEAVVRSVYGDAKYERLVALKRAFDPDNVFRLNQNIRP
ncbi:MAG: FAD-binding oxidoreductase [Actinomycetota bacterium]